MVIPRKFFIRRHISPDLGDATTIQFQDISFYVIVYGYLIPLNFRSTTIQLHVSTIDSLPRYILTVTDTKVFSQWPKVHPLSSWLSNSSARHTAGSANNADSPECVYPQAPAPMMPAVAHTTNASHAIAPWALALAPHQEPEPPQRVHAMTARPNHQAKSRCLAVSPTRISCPRRIGRQTAAPASWSQDLRPRARNCFSGLENYAFWVLFWE